MEPEEHVLVLSAQCHGLALDTATSYVLKIGDLIAAFIADEWIDGLVLPQDSGWVLYSSYNDKTYDLSAGIKVKML
jgi:hypothetical protein